MSFRDVLLKLRMGMLPLSANYFRYAHENASKILCNLCETVLKMKFTSFASVRYTRNFVRNTCTALKYVFHCPCV